jgi:hypothetical protein
VSTCFFLANSACSSCLASSYFWRVTWGGSAGDSVLGVVVFLLVVIVVLVAVVVDVAVLFEEVLLVFVAVEAEVVYNLINEMINY